MARSNNFRSIFAVQVQLRSIEIVAFGFYYVGIFVKIEFVENSSTDLWTTRVDSESMSISLF